MISRYFSIIVCKTMSPENAVKKCITFEAMLCASQILSLYRRSLRGQFRCQLFDDDDRVRHGVLVIVWQRLYYLVHMFFVRGLIFFAEEIQFVGVDDRAAHIFLKFFERVLEAGTQGKTPIIKSTPHKRIKIC